MDFSKFDKKVDLAGLRKDVAEAKENGGTREDVPKGTYEVKVNKMELTESKKGDPMLTIWFKILNGNFKNSMIFYNQVISQGFQIHLASEMLRSLDSGLDVEFESYEKFNSLVMDIAEAIDGKLEYAIEYGENGKGFNTYKITDVFEVE